MTVLTMPWRRTATAQKAPPAIVVLKNRATGLVLDHFNGQSIQALDDDERHPRHQWRREPTSKGFVAYRNVATGMVLDHYGARSIEAFSDNVSDHHHQWREVPVGDGFVAIRNRATGKALGHWAGEVVRAPSDALDDVHHHWQVLEARLASTVIALQNRATGRVVAHHLGVSIEALDDDASRAHHQWHCVWLQNGYVAFLNVATGMALDHYGGRSVQALDADISNLNHQWRHVDVGGGFVGIQNRGTGKVLEHWYGESIQARHEVADHVDRQWRVLEVRAPADYCSDDDWEDSILLEDGPLAEAMLIELPVPTEDGESSGGWVWPRNNNGPSFPSANAGALARRAFSVGGLLHRTIPAAVSVLAERFSDVARYLAMEEATQQIDRLAPLFRPLPRSQGVQLFAHHDVVLTMVQLFDHYRTSRDTFAAILSQLGPSLIRDNRDHASESMRSFLLRPLAPVIMQSMWDDQRRAGEHPTLAALSEDERARWRQFVPLPRSRQFWGVHRAAKCPFSEQAAPLTLWELVAYFFRVVEAQLQIEHGVELSRLALQYNSILATPNAHGVNEYALVRRGQRLDTLRLRDAPLASDGTAGMWHVLTFRDTTECDDRDRIAEFSVAFVLRASDANAVLVENPSAHVRPFTYEPLHAATEDAFELSRHAKYHTAPHYRLVALPGGLDSVERWANQSDVGALAQAPFLGADVKFFLTPDAVNGLETLHLDERATIDGDDEL